MNPLAFFHTPRRWLLFLALASTLMLAAALVAQYGFGLYPCELCIWQRYPYAAIAAIGLLAAFFARSEKLLFNLALLCALLLLANAGLSFYHAGVEWGIFPGPSGCANQIAEEQTLEEMRAALLAAPLVTCDQAMGYVLGLSLAVWNAIIAAALALLTFFVLHKIRKAA